MASATSAESANRGLGKRLTGLLWTVLLSSWFLTSVSCGSAPSAGPAMAWAEGPVRWLLLPQERKQLRKLRNRREAVLFIELFWRRRDPDPTEPGNPFLQTFHDRVQAADQLYPDEGVRGSLTDRGRALVLLGPPPILRQRVRTVTLERPESQTIGAPGQGEPEAREQRTILKVWYFDPESLDPRMVEELGEEERTQGIELVFAQGEEHTRLIDGARYLELAAEVLARWR